MAEPPAPESLPADAPDRPADHDSRLQLVWDVVLFQFKLVADGLRDVLLSPLSIAAGLLGLMAGGGDPHRYFRRLLRFGRRTELWINLFGQHRKRRGTSDQMVDPFRERVFTRARQWESREPGERQWERSSDRDPNEQPSDEPAKPR